MGPTGSRPRGIGRALEVGEQTFLRRITPGDEAELCRVLRRSRAFHRPWSPRPPAGLDPAGPEAFRRLARREKAQLRLLICRLEDGAIAGSVTLSQIFRGVLQSAYVGYWVDVEQRRRGYVREGLSLMLDHAFGPLGLHRVEANIIPDNAPSIGLVRGLGFRREGLARRYLKIAGRWQDHERWAMLAEEWRGEPRARRRRKA